MPDWIPPLHVRIRQELLPLKFSHPARLALSPLFHAAFLDSPAGRMLASSNPQGMIPVPLFWWSPWGHGIVPMSFSKLWMDVTCVTQHLFTCTSNNRGS